MASRTPPPQAAKTKVWNFAGILPPGVLALAPDSPIWVGGYEIPSAERGVVALGVPRWCSPPLPCRAFVYEASHLPEPAHARTQLALRPGGPGLRSATRHAPATYWASWADALRAIAFAHEVAGSLATDPLPLAPKATSARDAGSLSAIGFDCCLLQCQPGPKRTRPLTSLVFGSARPKPLTTFAIGPSFVKPTLPRQAGPHAACVLTTRPTLPEFPACSRHHARLPCYCCRPPAQGWRPPCRSCLAHCKTSQRAHVP